MPIVQADQINYAALSQQDSWCQLVPARAAAPVDPFAGYNVLLMLFAGNGSDRYGHAFTAAGSPGVSYVADWASGGQALSVNGGTDCLYLTTASTDFAPQGPACLEALVMLAAGDIGTNHVVLSIKQPGLGNLNTFSISVNYDGTSTRFNGIVASGGSNNQILGDSLGPALSAGVSYHVALTRDASGNYQLWVNGALVDQNTYIGSSYTPPFAAADVTIGATNASGGGAGGLNGKISWARFANGVPRYTAPFTPPSKPT